MNNVLRKTRRMMRDEHAALVAKATLEILLHTVSNSALQRGSVVLQDAYVSDYKRVHNVENVRWI